MEPPNFKVSNSRDGGAERAVIGYPPEVFRNRNAPSVSVINVGICNLRYVVGGVFGALL